MQHPLYATYLINQSFNSDFKVVLNSVPSFARSYGNIMDVQTSESEIKSYDGNN